MPVTCRVCAPLPCTPLYPSGNQAAAKRDIDSAVRDLKRGSAIRNGSLTTALVTTMASLPCARPDVRWPHCLGGLLKRIRGVESWLDDAVLDEAA
jgi:hypothetical protein